MPECPNGRLLCIFGNPVFCGCDIVRDTDGEVAPESAPVVVQTELPLDEQPATE